MKVDLPDYFAYPGIDKRKVCSVVKKKLKKAHLTQDSLFILVNICILFEKSTRGILTTTNREDIFIKSVLRFILYTIYDRSQTPIGAETAGCSGTVVYSIKTISNYIDTKDKKYYSKLLIIDKVYPILSIGVNICKLKSELYGYHRNRKNIKVKRTKTQQRTKRIHTEILKLRKQAERQIEENIKGNYFIGARNAYKYSYDIPNKYL